MKSTIFFKNTTPELILAFLFSASIYIIKKNTHKKNKKKTKKKKKKTTTKNTKTHART